jgi:hypothetical protein
MIKDLDVQALGVRCKEVLILLVICRMNDWFECKSSLPEELNVISVEYETLN